MTYGTTNDELGNFSFSSLFQLLFPPKALAAILDAEFKTHVLRGPQEVAERGSELAQRAPELDEGLNDIWKAEVFQKKLSAFPVILPGNCWEKSLLKSW